MLEFVGLFIHAWLTMRYQIDNECKLRGVKCNLPFLFLSDNFFIEMPKRLEKRKRQNVTFGPFDLSFLSLRFPWFQFDLFYPVVSI